MAVLLVGLAIMSVMLTVAMPVWRQMVQREKEEELIFRGTQYARAVGLYGRKFGGGFPPNVDFLVKNKFLRKKYKDPMVKGGEFQLVPAGATGQAGQVAGTLRGQSGLMQQSPGSSSARSGSGSSSGFTYLGPFVGVVSKSTEKSIRLYNGRDHYNQWIFVYSAAGGRGAGGRGTQGTQGGRGGMGPSGQGRGGRGRGYGPGGSE